MNTPGRLPKPLMGEACNRCGYCCSTEPCQIAREFLGCRIGPCVALERIGDQASCGMVRNPLGYLFNASRPAAEATQTPGDPPDIPAATQLSEQIAAALGIGKGCDAQDDDASRDWNAHASDPMVSTPQNHSPT